MSIIYVPKCSGKETKIDAARIRTAEQNCSTLFASVRNHFLLVVGVSENRTLRVKAILSFTRLTFIYRLRSGT